MTGENIRIINGSVHLDHVVSAKEIHNDGGRILAGIEGVDLANTKTNLALTRYEFELFQARQVYVRVSKDGTKT